MDKIDNFITDNKDKWLNELSEYIAIPSISKSGIYGSKDISDVANWLTDHFKKIGFQSELIETLYDPLVFAEWKNPKNKFTLLLYSQADVQPADPLEEWNTSPFKLTLKDGKLFARGISDSKGHLFAYIKGIESYLKLYGTLPINIKFIIDCDEETDEVSLPWFIKNHPDKLTADAILIAAGNMVAPNTPSICYGYRGMLATEIEVQTLKNNLHSGTFGGGVINPIECLATILSKLKGEDNKISIPGFYTDVASFDSEKPIYATAHYSENDFLEVAGATKVNCENGFSLDESLAARPTLDINGIYGGSTPEAFQYIIPAKASAKISFRLVPNQNPEDIYTKLEKYLKDTAPTGCEINIKKIDAALPIIIDKNSPFAEKLKTGLKKVFDKEAVWYREGGSVAVVNDFKKLTSNVFMVGFGSPDDNIHAPNEKLNLEDFFREIKFSTILMEELSC